MSFVPIASSNIILLEEVIGLILMEEVLGLILLEEAIGLISKSYAQ